MENVEKKTYETPQLQCLGSVRELTTRIPPTNCSVIGPDAFSTVDEACEIPT